MSKKNRAARPASDDVDRAFTEAGRAVVKLVAIAAAHPDPELASKAARALEELGSMPAVPLVVAIEQIPWESRRLMLMTLLRDVSPGFNLQVILALTRVVMSDPSEKVRAAAGETLGILRRRSLAIFRRSAAREPGQQADHAEASGATAG